MQTESPQFMDARCARYEFSLTIQTSRNRLWRGITEEIREWWLPDFHMLGEDSLVIFEPYAGGRLYEEYGDRSLLWYTVLSITPMETLELGGYCSAKYGGPATTMLQLDLIEEAVDRTRLRVSDALFGQISDGFVRSLQTGWLLLFQVGLQRFVESHS